MTGLTAATPSPGTAVAPGRLPRAVVVPALLGIAVLVLPLLALILRADWATFPAAVSTPAALSALGLSLGTALVATLLCVLLGVPLALLIARSGPRVAATLRTIVTVPLVLPPMVGGLALLYLLGRSGVLGQVLELGFGIRLPFTTAAVVIAQVFVALPFLVISFEGALRSRGTGFERAAEYLGAGRWYTLTRVTLPLAAPPLFSATALCFARALGEFGATALFAGNAEGTTRTMPLAIYTAFNGAGVATDTAVALALLLLALAVAVIVLLRAWGDRAR